MKNSFHIQLINYFYHLKPYLISNLLITLLSITPPIFLYISKIQFSIFLRIYTLIFTQKFLIFFKKFHNKLFTKILHFIKNYLHHLNNILKQIFPIFKLILYNLNKNNLLKIYKFKTNLNLIFLFKPHLNLKKF